MLTFKKRTYFLMPEIFDLRPPLEMKYSQASFMDKIYI